MWGTGLCFDMGVDGGLIEAQGVHFLEDLDER